MAVSELDGALRSYTLTRQVEIGHVGPDDLWVKDDEAPESFRVWFKASSNPAVVAQVGADSLSTAVRGRMLEPLEPPVTAASGAEYDVVETGQKLTVIWMPASPIAEIDEALGRAWIGKLSG